jgi:DNA polymerase-3 subunit epsilon
VGFFDRFRKSKPAAPVVPLTYSAPGTPVPGFAVIDVETTGLSSASHRILELAVVRTDTAGRVIGEWVCRFNPEGPVGATHIHGIRDADVVGAPRFAQVLPEVTHQLVGAAIAGHNVRFDLAFLRTEYARAGWALPYLPALCTLDASWVQLPQLGRRRLADCCAASGIALAGAHSALGDARATAVLLASYLDPQFGTPPGEDLLGLPQLGWAVAWPTAPGGVRPPVTALPPRVQRKIAAGPPPVTPLVGLLGKFRLADALDEGVPNGSLAYLELLAEVLEDGILTDDERAALRDLADIYTLSPDDVAAAHRGFLLALVHLALDDGKVIRAEKAELLATAALLDVPAGVVTDLLDTAEAARHARLSAELRPLPTTWTLGEPLRVGDKVAFTGCGDTVRTGLEQRAERLGVRVMNNVSRRTAMLVTDGSFSGGKAADAAALGIRCVHPDQFAVLLDHLQPAVRSNSAVPRQPTGAPPATSEPAVDGPASKPESTVSPVAARAWARSNGFHVGERGRLPAEVANAYRRAHTTDGA